MTKTLIFLTNGQSVQTQTNGAADISGLINAGTQKIYTCTDFLDTSVMHHIVVEHMVDVYEVTI